MITPKELYNSLILENSSYETVICKIHKPCSKQFLCGIEQHTKVVDFDTVISKNSIKGQNTPKSVDAITYKNDLLIFVEIKGWNEFLKHQKVNDNTIDIKCNEYEVNCLEKLNQSVDFCKIRVNNEQFFLDTPIVYVIITDIKTGIESFSSNLFLLASTASFTTNHINKRMELLIKNYSSKEEIKEILPKIKFFYKQCSSFDDFINSL